MLAMFTKTDNCKYQKAAEVLRKQVMDGSLKPSERLPSERDLCVELGVSRITIRLALKLLCDEGFITRIHGSGTYVRTLTPSSPPPPRNVDAPIELSRTLVFHEWAPGALALQLCPEMSGESSVLHFKRQYACNSNVLIWDRCFIASEFADQLSEGDLINEHFTANWMRVQKFQIKTFTQIFHDVPATREDARVLGIDPQRTITESIEQFGTACGKVAGVFVNHYHPDLAKVNNYYHWLEANRVANIPKVRPERTPSPAAKS
jgi:DNA-binding GntR family transcriptional regulator